MLLDLAMPRMNSAEAATILRRSNPHAHLILFTMYRDSIGRDLSSAVGVERVIAKQGGFEKLIECIESFPERIQDNVN